MRRLADIARSVWKWWSYLCGCLVLLLLSIVCLVGLQQWRKDRSFVQAELLPLARYVEDFRDSHRRLPTEDEFNSWASTNRDNKAVWYYSKQPSFMSDWGTPDRDFVVGMWRGEWVEYYRSWDGKNFDGSIH